MKELVLKDWLFGKIARENNVGRVWGGHVDCIFQETEKAYKVIMGAVNRTVITWVPKSQCEFVDAEHEGQQTYICKTYEEAIERVGYIRNCYC